MNIGENKRSISQPSLGNEMVRPMLAKEIKHPFNNDAWLFELKLDGYRAIANIKNGNVHLYSRNLNSLNSDFRAIVEELKQLDINIILDGEIVLYNEIRKPDFQKLQNYKNNSSLPVFYYIFDILAANDINVCKVPLLKRKELLVKLIKEGNLIRLNEYKLGKGIDFFDKIKDMDMEGIMAKKIDSLYYPGKRSSSWLKIKNHKSIDVIIAGYTKPSGSRKYFGSLVLAVNENNKLKYAGNVGTGFDEYLLKSLSLKLEPKITNINPFKTKIMTITPVTWVKPEIKCEVTYSNLTNDGIMRHPVFKSLK